MALKLSIDDGKKRDKDIHLRLRLVQKDSGGVTLFGTEEDGSDWYIVTIREDGTLDRHGAIPPSTGLKLDNGGRIKLHK